MTSASGPYDSFSEAWTIAEGVRSGTMAARQVVDEHLARIAAHEDRLHAFNLTMADEARSAADAVDAAVAAGRDPGPLAGVPIALKDNLCTRGIPTTCSSRILGSWKPPYDATVVSEPGRGRRGGGRQDQPRRVRHGVLDRELGVRAYPQPLDLDRVPGGSSGGSAAAVAAGFAAVGLGSDTGGSIRQPAALCGVVGVKPTYGLVSRYGLIAFASSLDQIGPLARTVRDAALTAGCHLGS